MYQKAMQSYFNADLDERKINRTIIGLFYLIVFFIICGIEWEWQTSYCCKCVNVSSCLNQAGVQRIINSQHDWSQSAFQYITTRAAFYVEKLWDDAEKCRHKTEAEDRLEEFAVLFIRSPCEKHRLRSNRSTAFIIISRDEHHEN